MKVRAKCVSVAVVTVLVATCCILSARAWDNQTRYIRLAECGDANANLSKDQFPAAGCLEGHGCVVCNMFPQVRGDIVGPNGDLKLWLPQSHSCSGERRIGICMGSGGSENCDLEDYTADGTCSGSIQDYQSQSSGQ